MTVKDFAPFPEQIRLENTNACNAHCTICPREKLTRKIGVMAPGLLDRILDEARGRKITKFTIQGYGEPLLDKRFCEHMRKAKDALACPTFTVTNGSLVTPELARRLVACGLDKIKISFYGTNAREYEAVHTPLRYERTRAGVMALVRAKRAARSRIVIHLQYIGRLRRFIPFALQWLPKVRVGFNTLHNYGTGRTFNEVAGEGRTCPILTAPILQVLWNGDVVPCCYDFDGTMPLGNIYEETIERIWRGERYARLRRAHEAGDFSGYPVCRVCDKRF